MRGVFLITVSVLVLIGICMAVSSGNANTTSESVTAAMLDARPDAPTNETANRLTAVSETSSATKTEAVSVSKVKAASARTKAKAVTVSKARGGHYQCDGTSCRFVRDAANGCPCCGCQCESTNGDGTCACCGCNCPGECATAAASSAMCSEDGQCRRHRHAEKAEAKCRGRCRR